MKLSNYVINEEKWWGIKLKYAKFGKQYIVLEDEGYWELCPQINILVSGEWRRPKYDPTKLNLNFAFSDERYIKKIQNYDCK